MWPLKRIGEKEVCGEEEKKKTKTKRRDKRKSLMKTVAARICIVGRNSRGGGGEERVRTVHKRPGSPSTPTVRRAKHGLYEKNLPSK